MGLPLLILNHLNQISKRWICVELASAKSKMATKFKLSIGSIYARWFPHHTEPYKLNIKNIHTIICAVIVFFAIDNFCAQNDCHLGNQKITKNNRASSHGMIHMSTNLRANQLKRFRVIMPILSVTDRHTDWQMAFRYLPSRAYQCAGR